MKNIAQIIFLTFYVLLACNAYAQEQPILRLGADYQLYPLREVIVTKDKRCFFTAGEGRRIEIRRTDDGSLIDAIELQMDLIKQGVIYALALSPDETCLAVAGNMGDVKGSGDILLLNLQTKKIDKILTGHKSSVHTLSFTDNSKYLISGSSDNTVKVWDYQKNICLQTIRKHTNWVYCVKAASDTFYTSAFDGWVHGWKIFDTIPFNSYYTATGTHSFGLSNAKDLLVVSRGGSNNQILLLDKNLHTVDSIKNCFADGSIAFSDDDKYVVCTKWHPSETGIIFSIFNNRILHFTKLDDYDIWANNASAFIGNHTLLCPSWEIGLFFYEIREQLDSIILIKAKTAYEKMKQVSEVRSYRNTFTYNIYNYTNSTTDSLSKYFDLKDFSLRKTKRETSDTARRLERGDYYIKTGNFVLEYDSVYRYSLAFLKKEGISLFPFIFDGYNCWYDRGEFQTLGDSLFFFGCIRYVPVFNLQGNNFANLTGDYDQVKQITFSADHQLLYVFNNTNKIALYRTSDILSATARTSTSRTIGLCKSNLPGFTDSVKNNCSTKLLESTKVEDWDKLIQQFRQRTDSTSYQIALDLKAKRDFYSAAIIKPILYFAFNTDNEWMIYTEQGYFACSPNGCKSSYWHLNRGIMQTALLLPVDALYDKFYRPDIIREIVNTNKTLEDVFKERNEKMYSVANAMKGLAGVSLTADTSDAANGNIKLKITAHEIEGGGLSDILLFQNGKPVNSMLRFQVTVDSNSKAVMHEYICRTTGGDNHFKAIAYNRQLVESPAAYYLYKSRMIEDTANLYLYCVGIDRYKSDSLRLEYSVSDAQSILEKLQTKSKFVFKNIYVHRLYNVDASKEKILKIFDSLKAQIQPSDAFIFYYAGHALTTPATVTSNSEFYMGTANLTSVENTNPWLTQQAISSEELKSKLNELQSTQKFIVFDACQSGTAAVSFKRDQSLTKLSKNTGITILTGTKSAQFANEYSALGHGAFTHCLLKALDGAADETENSQSDNRVSLYEVIDYIKETLPDLVKQFNDPSQNPVYFKGGNDFVLTEK